MRERKTTQVVVRLTAQDRETYDREAEARGLDTSNFIRMTLKRALATRDDTSRQAVEA